MDINYTPKYGVVYINNSAFVMYGDFKHLHTAECEINGQVFSFNPVDVLKAYPETRSKKSMKAAAAYMTLHRGLGFFNLATAYIATKGTRMSRPKGLPKW